MKTKTHSMTKAAQRSRRYRERQKALRSASRNVTTVVPEMSVVPTETPVTSVTVTPRIEVIPPRRRRWSSIGPAAVGLAIVSTGTFIAYTSMRANAWFGHSLTPDPVAGEIYSRLSIAAEVIACLIPTAIRFHWENGEAWTAVRGWALMAVVLVVVFFAAGGFAVSNLSAGVEARAERFTAETTLAQRRLDTITKSRLAECARRGERCRKLEAEEQDAIAALGNAQASVRAEADPQAAALGISSTNLHLVQAGSMVALCLFSGLFISFGAGLIWPKN